VTDGSGGGRAPGAIWYTVAAAIFLTGCLPGLIVLPLGSPTGVHLGTRFRPDTTITVSLHAGERLAIHAGWADPAYVPRVTCRARTPAGRPVKLTRPNGTAGPERDGYHWSAMWVVHASEAGSYQVRCHNRSENDVILATANDPWLDEFADGIERGLLAVTAFAGFVLGAALAMGVGTVRALRPLEARAAPRRRARS
jgi:hypothetical protein